MLARFDHVGPGYFATVGIALLLGRDIGPRDDANAPRVAVINETMARFYFPDSNPIGKRLVWLPDRKQSLEIIGVAKNVQDHSVRWNPIRRFYVPLNQPVESISSVIFEVRTQVSPEGIMPALRRELQSADPAMPDISIGTLQDSMDRSLLRERVIAKLSSFFGVVALFLATLGLYGVMSYAVARRTSEIGIRMALGADSGRIIRMVLRETILLAASGIAVGIPVAMAAGRWISSWLFGLKATDPGTIVCAMVFMFAITAVAGYIPAWRASRMDPLIALRCE